MKVIHYIPSIDRTSGGIGFYMQLLAAELGKLSELHVVTVKSNNELKLENCVVHYISSGILNSVKRDWINILNKVNPDVIHINCCWTPQCSFTQKWAQELNYKVILTPHGMLEPWIIKRNFWTKKIPALFLYQRKAIKKANIIHATAESEKANLLKLGYNKNIKIIPNGIEVNNIKIKENWERKKKILFLSRIHVKKGIEFLISAANQLQNKLEDYKFIIAGEGEHNYIDYLKNRCKEEGVEHLFNFYGGVYEDKKWKLFKEADIFILPTFSENFGIVVAEALACGTPVITTTGTPWIELNSSKCGWCVTPTQSSITEAIYHAISAPAEELEAMGRRGRELIEQNYSIDAVAQMMKELYTSLQ